MIRRPFALVGFAFALTLLAVNLFNGSVFVFVSVGGCILLMCLLMKTINQRGVYAVAMLAVLLACFCFNVRETYTYKPVVELAGENKAVHAQLVSNPVYSEGTWRYTLKAFSFDGEAVNCKMVLSSKDAVEAQPYDFIDFSGEIISIEQINPDIKNYYKSKDIFLVSYGFDSVSVQPCENKPIGYYFLKANAYLCSRLRAALDGDASALAVGVLTGNKTDISQRLQNSFSKTGLSHVLAVSGLHMSILVLSLYKLLCKLSGRYRRVAEPVCIIVAVLYAGVTGFSPSATRACIMLSAMLAGKFISRRADTLNSMGFAALIIAVINPYAVTDWSFMLSFSATLGIVLLNRNISNFSKRVCSKIGQPNIAYAVRVLVDSAGISLAATVFCLPVMVLFVGAVSTVFLPANLLVLYAVPVVLISALVTAVLPAAVCAPAAKLCEIFCEYIIGVVELLSRFEYASISTDSMLVKASLAAVAIIILLASVFIKNKKLLYKFSAIAIMFAVALNICFGAAMNYKQVNIAVGENCIVVYRGSTAAAIVYGYYGCYRAAEILDEYCINNVSLLLPVLEEDSNIYQAEEFFENYNVERLIINEKHDYRFLAENYEITESTAFEFGGVRFEYCGSFCRVICDSGTVLIALEPDIKEFKTDFIITANGLPEWAKPYDYTAVINGGKNISAAYGGKEYSFDTCVLLRYNGFGRYEVKGW